MFEKIYKNIVDFLIDPLKSEYVTAEVSWKNIQH